MKSTNLSRTASAHLDMIRGISALAVLFGHIRGLFFLDFRNIESSSLLVRIVYALTGLGHQAVIVFFVLSGFLVGGSVLKKMPSWSWAQYLIDRLTRLYIVLLPALVITAAADFVGWHFQSGATYYAKAIPHFNTLPYRQNLSFRTFVGNGLFLQKIAVPTFGSNDPLWSLANEFWYYLLFPGIALLFTRNPNLGRYRNACITLLFMILLPRWLILPGFGIWLTGAAICICPHIKLTQNIGRVLVIVAGAFFGVALVLARSAHLSESASDIAVGLSFALWLYFLVRTSSFSGTSGTYMTLSRLLSSCSYSLYAIHFPLVLLIRAAMGGSPWYPTLGALTCAGGIALGMLALAYIFSQLTESHTPRVRHWLSSRLSDNSELIDRPVSA